VIINKTKNNDTSTNLPLSATRLANSYIALRFSYYVRLAGSKKPQASSELSVVT